MYMYKCTKLLQADNWLFQYQYIKYLLRNNHYPPRQLVILLLTYGIKNIFFLKDTAQKPQSSKIVPSCPLGSQSQNKI